MWEFPNARVEANPARALTKAIKAGYGLEVRAGEALGVFNHAYTHFRVTVHAFHCELLNPIRENSRHSPHELKWVKLPELDDYPMGKVDRQIARKIKDLP
jgi:A/G-specific adenine glycosylase